MAMAQSEKMSSWGRHCLHHGKRWCEETYLHGPAYLVSSRNKAELIWYMALS